MKRKTQKKTVIQQLTEWQSKLKPISQRMIDYAHHHCFDKFATESKNTMMCTECGHTWKVKDGANINSTVCPHCKAKLTDVKHHSLRYKEIEYFCITFKSHGYQVIRYFQFRKTVKPGSVTYWHAEVGAKWINEKGVYYDFNLPRVFIPRYVDAWNFDGDIKYRRSNGYYGSLLGWCCPAAVWHHSMLPILKRNGWNGQALYYNIDDVVTKLLTSPVFESFYKQRNFGLCIALIKNEYHNRITDTKWARLIKICNRHNRKFTTYNDWKDFQDYVRDLEYFHLDIYNPKYLLPKDFMAEHLRLSAERHRIEQEARMARQREHMERIAKEQENRRKWLLEYPVRFCDMLLKNSDLTIRPLIVYKDFEDEHIALGHCICTYYGKPHTLLISIEHNGVKAETAEIDLMHNEIVQCRGHKNQPSDWHKSIVKFVKASLNEFQKRYKKEMSIPTTSLPAVITPNPWVAIA